MSDDNLDIGHRPPGYISWTWSQTRETRTCRTFKGRYRPESEARRSRLLRICRDVWRRPSFWAKKRELLAELQRIDTVTVPPIVQWNPNGDDLRCVAVNFERQRDTFTGRYLDVRTPCPNPKDGHPKFCVRHRHLVSPPPPEERGKRKWNPDGGEFNCRVTGNIPRRGEP